MRTRTFLSVGVALTVILGTLGTIAAVGFMADDTAEAHGRGGHRFFQLALARFATARYHNVDNAMVATAAYAFPE